MDRPSEVFKDARRIRNKINAARSFAESRGIAMTVERLGVYLGVSSRTILEFALGEDEPPKELREAHKLLFLACEEIAASHIEHGMTKGNNPSMDILLLKNNLQYHDKPHPAARNTGVVIVGEDEIPE
ncbi:MAG: hypothetical protein PHR24_02130 [Oscillospiraceae bacterium]|nr:hypothetical protein [Oscillospiraceae bacterium]